MPMSGCMSVPISTFCSCECMLFQPYKELVFMAAKGLQISAVQIASTEGTEEEERFEAQVEQGLQKDLPIYEQWCNWDSMPKHVCDFKQRSTHKTGNKTWLKFHNPKQMRAGSTAERTRYFNSNRVNHGLRRMLNPIARESVDSS